MASKLHHYNVTVQWTGNRGQGTESYKAFTRHHTIMAAGKADISGSSDPAFLGDETCWNPEELFLGSLSACHKLWYLHLCSVSEIIVISYIDHASGVMEENPDGSGQFLEATLHPTITISAKSDAVLAEKLHHKAHKLCFIARSVNFPVHHKAEIIKES